jgi:hypothetical protein
MAVFLPTYFAMDCFEGAIKATVRTRWWWHLLCAEICWRFANVKWTYFVHVKLVMQINFRQCTVHTVLKYVSMLKLNAFLGMLWGRNIPSFLVYTNFIFSFICAIFDNWKLLTFLTLLMMKSTAQDYLQKRIKITWSKFSQITFLNACQNN